MPRLANQIYRKRNKVGREAFFECRSYAFSDGSFAVVYPDELESLLHNYTDSWYDKKAPSSGVGQCSRVIGGQSYKILIASNLQAIHDTIHKAMDIYVREDVASEHVICVAFQNHCTYRKNNDGTICVRHQDCKDETAEWIGPEQIGGFGLTLQVKVCVKTTYSVPGLKEKIEFELPDGEWMNAHPVAQSLNSLYRMPKSLFRAATNNGMVTKVLPYSDEMALFLNKTLEQLASMADNIRSFFLQEDENLISNIKKGQKLLS